MFRTPIPVQIDDKVTYKNSELQKKSFPNMENRESGKSWLQLRL